MPGGYNLSGTNIRSFVDGYGLLQSFTTGDTAQSLQSGIVTLAQLEALTGVLALNGADGARLLFARSSGATTLTVICSVFEPICNAAGTAPSFFVERIVSPVVATSLTTGVVAVGTALNTTNMAIAATTAPALTTIASTALWISSSGAWTAGQPCANVFSASSTGGVAHVDIGGVNGAVSAAGGITSLCGATHLRVMLSCATASESIFCLAKRLRGASGNLAQN